MSNVATAHGAYRKARLATGDMRSIEAEAFRTINNQLSRAFQNRGHDYPGFVEALSRNVSLWTIIASDVARDENRLPPEVRARLFRLSQFVRRHTRDIFLGGGGPDIAALTEINSNMIAGLCGSRQDAS